MDSVNGAGHIWIRDGLASEPVLHGGLDTALFDVDGVLIDTRRSYLLSLAHASEHLVRVVNGLDAPSPMVTPEAIALFKRAGGFNSDWDATQLFASLWTARLREWRGLPESTITLEEWAQRAAEAAADRCGGVMWVRETFPASAIPADDVARWAHDEFYWGAKLVDELYGHKPQYAPAATGFVHNEEMLIESDLLPALKQSGITRFGLITGRYGAEVTWALRKLSSVPGYDALEQFESDFGLSPFKSIVPAMIYTKPDPRALRVAIEETGARGAFYVGDTADDLDLVLRYRAELAGTWHGAPPVLAIQVACGEDALTYQRRGADIIIEHVRDLPRALALATSR